MKKANGFYNCLRRGHLAHKCKVNVKCSWYNKHHVLLMCNKICQQDSISVTNESKIVKSETNLTTLIELPNVCLQILRCTAYSDSGYKIVRVAFDSMSHRSYICKNIAKELGYQCTGNIEISHALFGGIKSKPKVYDTYKVRIKNFNDTYACNFDIIAQDVICDNVETLKNFEWMDELRENNVTLTDVGDNRTSIDILIGGDVGGKLYTSKKFELSNGLTLFETFLGWTVTGKLLDEYSNFYSIQNSLLAQDTCPSELWQLDILGISDPIEKVTNEQRNDKIREFLKEITILNKEGRYEISLPFIEDRALLPENFKLSRKRLDTTIAKLKKLGILEKYDKNFVDWLREGIIEVVTNVHGEKISHFLPHRAVIKPNSITPVRNVWMHQPVKTGPFH